MQKSLSVLILAVILGGSAALAQDGLSGAPRTSQTAKVDLPAKVAAYTAGVRDRAIFTPDNAAAELRAGYDEVLSLSLERVDLAKVDADPHGLLRGLFELMLAIDDRCAEFHAAGRYTPEVANAKRRALRAIRYLREAVMLRTQARAPELLYARGKPKLAELFGEHHWTVREEYRAGGLEVLPRTVLLLCMGSSNVSATIARSADEDNTFSHLAVGYRSNAPQEVEGTTYPAGTLFLVESLIETGVIIKPFAEHYQGVDRDVIFLVRDRSKQAAVDAAMDAFFARANAAIHAGDPLGYDFSMGAHQGVSQALDGEQPSEAAALPDPDAYFCAAVADEVLAKAGVTLFPVRSGFKHGPNSRALFESWGIDPDSTVTAPGDADVSPALLRVAEAGRLANLEANHLRQAVLRQMFQWMDQDNYQLRWPLYVHFFTWVAGGLNDTKLDLGKVPSGMNKHILRTFMALDKAASLYYDALAQANEAFKAERGHGMAPQDMVAHLDRIRDDVKGTRKWFRKQPWAQGVYHLRHSKRLVERLTVEPAEAGFRVERELWKDGALLERSAGRATQKQDELRVRLEGSRETATSLTYELEFDGHVKVKETQEPGWIAQGTKHSGPTNE